MLRIAPAVPLSQIELPTDGSPIFLRLADTSGSFAGQYALRPIGQGMYGVMQKSNTVTGDRFAIRLHSTLPTTLAGLGQVEIFPHSQVEVVKADNAGDFALLGLQYLSRLGEMIKTRLNLGGNQEALDMMSGYLKAEMAPHAKKLAGLMQEGGIKVVEVEETAVVSRRVYFVTDAETAIANLSEGVALDEGVDFTMDTHDRPTRVVKLADAQSIEDLLVKPQRVRQSDAAAFEVQDAIVMTPFLAALTGSQDFLDDDDSDDDGMDAGDFMRNGISG